MRAGFIIWAALALTACDRPPPAHETLAQAEADISAMDQENVAQQREIERLKSDIGDLKLRVEEMHDEMQDKLRSP